MQNAITDSDARVVALHQIERSAHDTGVDAFLRGTTLNVLDITFERDQNRSQELSGSSAAITPAWATKLNVEPWEVRRS